MKAEQRSEFCCGWFGESLGQDGQLGFSFTLEKLGDRRRFAICCRSIPIGEDALARQFQVEVGLSVLLSIQTLPCAFCPSCGTDLGGWIERNSEWFDGEYTRRQFGPG